MISTTVLLAKNKDCNLSMLRNRN